MALEDRIDSQNMHREYASVWEAKCKELQRKINDFGGSVGREDRIDSQNMHLE